ncbi:MAG: PAS domain-containing protein [Bilophila wadsworthia]
MLQEYLDQLFDAFKEGICISDVEGTVVHLNRRHAEITGIPAKRCWGIP